MLICYYVFNMSLLSLLSKNRYSVIMSLICSFVLLSKILYVSFVLLSKSFFCPYYLKIRFEFLQLRVAHCLHLR